MNGKSSCSSVALSSRKSSNTMSSTLCGRAFSRSILLMTTIGLAPVLQRLFQHELRLRLRAVVRIHHQQHAVHHLHDALDFAAEVGVAGSVDDVDVVIVPVEGGVLGADGDALFAFEVHRVHDPDLGGLGFVGAEGAGLLEELVHERGLAVVDVGDDGDVSDLFHRIFVAVAPGSGVGNMEGMSHGVNETDGNLLLMHSSANSSRCSTEKIALCANWSLIGHRSAKAQYIGPGFSFQPMMLW